MESSNHIGDVGPRNGRQRDPFFDGVVIASLRTKNGGLNGALIPDTMATAEYLDQSMLHQALIPSHVFLRGSPYTGKAPLWSPGLSELPLPADGVWKPMRFAVSGHSEEIRRNSAPSPTRFQAMDAVSTTATQLGT
jgi:hypothetical protein